MKLSWNSTLSTGDNAARSTSYNGNVPTTMTTTVANLTVSQSGSTDRPPPPPPPYDIVHFMQGELSLLWLVFGTVGNLLSLAVLLRRKMRIHSTFTYLMLLSVCDTLVLYFGLARDYLVHKHDMNVSGRFVCKLHVFAFYFVLHMASWLLVAVNIDRLIAASFLTLSKRWCTPRTAYKVSLYLALSLLALNAHFLFFVDSPESSSSSSSSSAITTFKVTTIVNKSLSMNDSALFSKDTLLIMTRPRNLSRSSSSASTEWLVPHQLVTLISPKIGNNNGGNDDEDNNNYVHDAFNTSGGGDGGGFPNVDYFEIAPNEPVNPYVYRKCMIKPNYPRYSFFFQNVFTWIDASAQVILPFVIMLVCNVNIIHKVLLTKNRTNGKNIKRLRKIKGMCIMIVSVSVIFFILEAPVLIFICLMQGNYIQPSWPHIHFTWTLMNLMMYTNHVINFLSYCMTGTKFRRELLRLFYMHKAVRFMSMYNKNVNMLNTAVQNRHRHHKKRRRRQHDLLHDHAHDDDGLGRDGSVVDAAAGGGNATAEAVAAVTTKTAAAAAADINEAVDKNNNNKKPSVFMTTTTTTTKASCFNLLCRNANAASNAIRKLSNNKLEKKNIDGVINADDDAIVIDTTMMQSAKPTSLTNRIINKKVQLGESAISRSIAMRTRYKSDENDEDDDDDDDDDDDEEDDDDDEWSSSTSPNSPSSPWNKVAATRSGATTTAKRKVSHKKQKHHHRHQQQKQQQKQQQTSLDMVKSQPIERSRSPTPSQAQATDNNNNNHKQRLVTMIAKDDITIGGGSVAADCSDGDGGGGDIGGGRGRVGRGPSSKRAMLFMSLRRVAKQSINNNKSQRLQQQQSISINAAIKTATTNECLNKKKSFDDIEIQIDEFSNSNKEVIS